VCTSAPVRPARTDGSDCLPKVRAFADVVVVTAQGAVQQGELGLLLFDPPSHHDPLPFQYPSTRGGISRQDAANVVQPQPGLLGPQDDRDAYQVLRAVAAPIIGGAGRMEQAAGFPVAQDVRGETETRRDDADGQPGGP
jgi:hypothetical protein